MINRLTNGDFMYSKVFLNFSCCHFYLIHCTNLHAFCCFLLQNSCTAGINVKNATFILRNITIFHKHITSTSYADLVCHFIQRSYLADSDFMTPPACAFAFLVRHFYYFDAVFFFIFMTAVLNSCFIVSYWLLFS